jgi:hypothetical protein
VKSSYDLHTHTTSGFANGQCENALLASRATTLVIFVRGMSTPQPKDTEVMRIAVTTPTGHVGQHLVRTLLRAGVRPLVLTRDPQNLDPRVRDAVDAEVIDQFDADSVVAATVGVDALYWVDPPPPGPDPLADYALATDAVTRAVAENGIGRVVFQSSVGAEKRRGVGEIDGLGATEVALNDTAAAVIHLRCGYFFTNLEMQIDDIRAGLLRVIVPVDRPMPWVAPRDIAEVAATRRRICRGWMSSPRSSRRPECPSRWSRFPTRRCGRGWRARVCPNRWSSPLWGCRPGCGRTLCRSNRAHFGVPRRRRSDRGRMRCCGRS